MCTVDAHAKQGPLKKSRGFAGYVLMIESVIKHENITGQKPIIESTI